jgi:plastocyanin
MKKFVLIPAVAIFLGVGLALIHPGTGEALTSPAAEQQVKIDNFTFAPATLTIAAGTAVRWTNHDDIPHNVVSEDRSFKSKALDTDEQFTYTFQKPGTYEYFCGLHPRMKGTITVK